MFDWFNTKRKLPPWHPEHPLFRWDRHDPFTLRDACAGLCCFGGTGAGKTSGVGHLIATAYLQAKFGFLVLCTKVEERDLWTRYCRETGRLDDLIVFSADGGHRFAAFDFETRHGGTGGGLTANLVNLIDEVLEMANGRERGAGSKGDEAFWLNGRKDLEWNGVDLLLLSGEPVSIPNLYEVIATAPRSPEQLASVDWQNNSYCFHRLLVMRHRARSGQLDERQMRDAARVAEFYQKTHVNLAEKTRSIIDSMFCSAASILNRGLLRDLFSTTTTVSPLDVLEGKVVVVDLPVESMGLAGLFAGILWKRSMQLALLRRQVVPGSRPVCIFADEAQSFITGSDANFLSTARSKLACNVYLSQNINNYIAALGAGEKAKAEVNSILGNAGTLVAHANSCPDTGQYMSERIGRTRQFLSNFGQSGPAQDWYSVLNGEAGQNESCGFSEGWEYQLQPSFYGTLRTGGQRHKKLVDAVVYSTGRTFRSTGTNWLIKTFKQV